MYILVKYMDQWGIKYTSNGASSIIGLGAPIKVMVDYAHKFYFVPMEDSSVTMVDHIQ